MRYYKWNVETGMIDWREIFRFDLVLEGYSLLRLAGCTHPCAQGGRMGGGFVMRMMGGMGHGLGIHHPAQGEQAERQTDRDETNSYV